MGDPSKRSVLLIITSDPRTNGRLAEAVRFTAGVTAWQKVDVTIYVGGDAVQGLIVGENRIVDRIVDEQDIVDFLPLIGENKQEVFVERDHPVVRSNRDEIPFPELNPADLAAVAAGQDYVMRF